MFSFPFGYGTFSLSSMSLIRFVLSLFKVLRRGLKGSFSSCSGRSCFLESSGKSLKRTIVVVESRQVPPNGVPVFNVGLVDAPGGLELVFGDSTERSVVLDFDHLRFIR